MGDFATLNDAERRGEDPHERAAPVPLIYPLFVRTRFWSLPACQWEFAARSSWA
jgi:hypothetical protein